ncbi:MAG: O-antigen ligase family protein [Candidatus Aquilonibacter sp.]
MLFLLFAWTVISLLWTVAPDVTWQSIQTYGGLALLYLAISLAPVTFKEFKFILWAIVVGFLVSAIIAVVLFRTHAPVVSPLHPENARVVLSLGNLTIDPNEYADALIFPFAIASMLALGSHYLSLKLLGFAAASVMVAAVIVSASREAVIGLGLVALYYLWRSRYRVQVFALLLVAAIAAGPFSATLFARLQHAAATGGAGRTSIWAVGVTAIKHYGIFGSGMGTFPIVYDQFYLSIPQIHSFGWSAPPHNVLLQFFVELGIIGLGLYLWFIAANFTMLRAITRDHPLYDYRLIVESGLIAVTATSLFIGSFNEKWVWLVFATAAQLVFLASTYRRVNRAAAAPE